jgi:hypothetical protein
MGYPNKGGGHIDNSTPNRVHLDATVDTLLRGVQRRSTLVAGPIGEQEDD